MSFAMSPIFPLNTFKEFGILASKRFSTSISAENDDPSQKRLHFERSFQAVRYRHRACSEQNETFKTLFTNAMADNLFREWSEGEDHHYKLEQCLYYFFINALSVLESFGFCLYFIGGMIDTNNFPKVTNPKFITLKATKTAFEAAFPSVSLTARLNELLIDSDFIRIDTIRNILAHRIIGRRTIHSFGTTHSDRAYTLTREDLWYIPGLSEKLILDEELMQRYFDALNKLVTIIVVASYEFMKSVDSKII